MRRVLAQKYGKQRLDGAVSKRYAKRVARKKAAGCYLVK